MVKECVEAKEQRSRHDYERKHVQGNSNKGSRQERMVKDGLLL